MYQPEPIPLGIVHGRFQPPHSGHIRYILGALKRAERVIIGIATPTLCTEEEAARTGYPCTPALNPFSFDERKEMITCALDAHNVLHERYSFIQFPSDYANLATLIPPNAVFLISSTSPADGRKMAHLAALGYETETVMRLPEGAEREHAEAVRESVREGTEVWKTLVPEPIAEYMESHGLLEKLR